MVLQGKNVSFGLIKKLVRTCIDLNAVFQVEMMSSFEIYVLFLTEKSTAMSRKRRTTPATVNSGHRSSVCDQKCSVWYNKIRGIRFLIINTNFPLIYEITRIILLFISLFCGFRKLPSSIKEKIAIGHAILKAMSRNNIVIE